MKVNKSSDNWIKKWRKYIFVVITISIIFGVSLLMTALNFMGIAIPFPAVWTGIAFAFGILILVFSLIIIGYLLLMVKPSKKKRK